MKKSAIMVMLFGAAFAATSATITVDNVQQRWPWNNKVDITYTITGDDLAGKVGKVTLTTIINGASYTVYDGPVGDAKVGTFTVTWENPPAGVNCNDCRMRATLNTCPVREGNDYMIIDLATGEVTYEGLFLDTDDVCGISGQELSNARYNVDKYKSTHYVLRKVPKGTYKTGDSVAYPSGNQLNNDRTWTTDKDFYIGVFQWTNFQYWYVFDLYSTSRDPSQQDLRARPLGFTRDIRGISDPTTTPPGATVSGQYFVIKWLNGKTGMGFDLPTELMHEIATRAGTTTHYFWGDDAGVASEYAVYGQSGGRPANGWNFKVGSRKPNAWGLYDMVGLDWQWCLDSYVAGEDPATREDVFTPYAVEGSTSNRRVRGQDAKAGAADLRSAVRSGAQTGTTSSAPQIYTFRIAYVVPNSGE